MEKDPFLQSKLAVRRWDDLAKEPAMETYPLDHYKDMAVKNLTRWSISSIAFID